MHKHLTREYVLVFSSVFCGKQRWNTAQRVYFTSQERERVQYTHHTQVYQQGEREKGCGVSRGYNSDERLVGPWGHIV